MHLGILGAADNYYVADLQRAASQYFPRWQVSLLRFGDLQVGIGAAQLEQRVGLPLDATITAAHAPASELAPTSAREPDSVLAPEALIVRSMPIGSLEQVIFRMDCLQTWLSRGVAIHNPPRSLEIAIDKWLCLQRLREAQVPVPATICCQTRPAAMEAFELLGGDVLIKPLFGGEGRGILRADHKDLAWRMFGTLQQLGQVLYLQQFVDHPGYDIRVLFVGDEPFAIRRVAAAGAWRTNITQGSHGEPHSLTAQQSELAERSRAAVGGTLLGIDLLPARDGRLFVLEVNAVPGWRGLAHTLRVDVAKEYLQVIAASALSG